MQGEFSKIGNYYALIKIEKESRKKMGQYCSECYNFCGKIVNGHKISLHRFPANPCISKVWTQRVKGIIKSPFTPHQNSRLCSAQFEGQDKVNVPTLFRDKTFKICLVCLKCFFLFLLILTHRCQSQRSLCLSTESERTKQLHPFCSSSGWQFSWQHSWDSFVYSVFYLQRSGTGRSIQQNFLIES